MIPISLELNNFMSYRGRTVVDFSEITMACLSGDNGAGKSALLDAVTWVLWGSCRAPRENDVITLGENEVEVTFVFRLGMHEYRVMRRRRSSGRPSLTFDSRPRGDEVWNPVGGDSVRETQHRITNTIKMDYDTFINSAFLMQGKADLFTQKTPSERKRILGEILRLGDYDDLTRLAREATRDARGRLEHLRSRVEQIDTELTTRPEIEQRLESIRDQLRDLGDLITRAEINAQQLAGQVEALETIGRARATTFERLERFRARANEIQDRIASDRKALADLDKLIVRSAEIEAGAGRLMEHRASLERCNQALADRQPLQARSTELEREIERQASSLQSQIDRAAEQVRLTNEKIAQLDEKAAELDRYRNEVARDTAKVAALEQSKLRASEMESEIGELRSDNRRLRDEMDEIKQRMDALDAGEATCPVCRRPFGEGDHDHIRDEWRAEGERLGALFRENRAKIEQRTSSLEELRALIGHMEQVAGRLQQRSALIKRLEDELGAREEVERELIGASAEHTRLLIIQKEQSFAVDERRELAKVQAKLDAIPYDAGQHDRVRAAVRKESHFEQEIQLLKEARVRSEGLMQRIRENEGEIESHKAEIEAAEKEIADLDRQLSGADKTRQAFDDARKHLQELTDQRTRIEGERGRNEQRIAELERLADERRKIASETETTGFDADVYRELSVAFGRNGIQAMIIENILPELEDEANRLLSRMAAGQLQVRFRTTREAVSNDNLIETLDIIIQDEYGERPYQLYSGGEAFRINFAIRVALSKLLARRAGATIDMLVVDEGFGTQDRHGRDGIVEALQSIASDFETVLVITHIDELRDQFPTRIEVVKTTDGSRVSVN